MYSVEFGLSCCVANEGIATDEDMSGPTKESLINCCVQNLVELISSEIK